MPGPAPKHPSRRSRSRSSDVVALPAEGRLTPAPPWPLGPDVNQAAELEFQRDRIAALSAELAESEDRRERGRLRQQLDRAQMAEGLLALKIEQARDAEIELWDLLWGTPQATMWDQSAAFGRMAAQFVRWNVRAEQGDLKAAPEARLRGAELGLTPMSLLRLRRDIAEAEAAEGREKDARERRAARRPKERAEAVDPRDLLG